MISQREKASFLNNNFSSRRRTIVTLNDTQGVTDLTSFNRNQLIDNLTDCFGTVTEPLVIDGSNLFFNKTEHIDYMLSANLKLKELREYQIEGFVMANKNARFQLFKSPYKVAEMLYPVRGNDNYHISSILAESEEPIVAYSSGSNNLMREIGMNIFNINGAFKRRDKNSNYYYAKAKALGEETIPEVLAGVEKNIIHLLTINNSGLICLLGLHVPYSLQKEELWPFKRAIILFNEGLKELSSKYRLNYINVAKLQNECHPLDINKPSILLTNAIIDAVYEQKGKGKAELTSPYVETMNEITGLKKMYYFSGQDIRKGYDDVEALFGKLAVATQPECSKDYIAYLNHEIARTYNVINECENAQEISRKILDKRLI